VIVEQLTLALAGGGIGLGLAAALVAAGRRGLVGLIPRIDRVAIDGRTFAIALCLAIVAGILSGLIPALLAVSPAVNRTVGLTSRAGLSARAVRSRDFLVAVQAALASLLLVGAGLTAKSMRRLLSEDLGFETERIWTFAIPLQSNRYQTPVAIDQFRVGVLDRIRAIPGVLAVGTAYSVPMDNRSTTSLLVENQPVPAGPPPEVGYNAADAGYFRTIGIPLREGRLFDQRDRADGRPVVVVNQALARRFFPGRSPIGARIRSGPNPNDPWLEIVGVIGDIRREARAVAPGPELYYPLSQDPTPYPSYVVKVADDPASVLARIRLAVKEQDPEVPMASVAPLETVVGQSVNRPRAVAGALFGFALLALATSAIGIYGVISFLVAERQREIAVRLAVGATASQVLVQTTRRGLAPMVLGLVAGLGASLLLRSVVRGFLYQVAPVDPGTYGLVIGAVLLAALLGALVPAVRAARLPPALVLRD
jgi:predicted permease